MRVALLDCPRSSPVGFRRADPFWRARPSTAVGSSLCSSATSAINHLLSYRHHRHTDIPLPGYFRYRGNRVPVTFEVRLSIRPDYFIIMCVCVRVQDSYV